LLYNSTICGILLHQGTHKYRKDSMGYYINQFNK